ILSAVFSLTLYLYRFPLTCVLFYIQFPVSQSRGHSAIFQEQELVPCVKCSLETSQEPELWVGYNPECSSASRLWLLLGISTYKLLALKPCTRKWAKISRKRISHMETQLGSDRSAAVQMTGLDIEKDSIIEMACLITDSDLNILAEGPNLIINQPDELLDGMSEWCKEHHGKETLFMQIRNSLTNTCLNS
uniref:RNA exonuclease 2 n=1 Tax=Crocodylus porosus TaxID=8502 RepID=A0A7M4EX96_CROPO